MTKPMKDEARHGEPELHHVGTPSEGGLPSRRATRTQAGPLRERCDQETRLAEARLVQMSDARCAARGGPKNRAGQDNERSLPLLVDLVAACRRRPSNDDGAVATRLFEGEERNELVTNVDLGDALERWGRSNDLGLSCASQDGDREA
jgi:hypothetical protein